MMRINAAVWSALGVSSVWTGGTMGVLWYKLPGRYRKRITNTTSLRVKRSTRGDGGGGESCVQSIGEHGKIIGRQTIQTEY